MTHHTASLIALVKSTNVCQAIPSILTLGVAIATILISYRAFQSQKKTEKLQKRSTAILYDIRHTEGVFRDNVNRFIQTVERNEALRQEIRFEDATTRIHRAVNHGVRTASILVDWLPKLSYPSREAAQAIYDRSQEWEVLKEQYDLDLIMIQDVGAWHIHAECARKITKAMSHIGLAITNRDTTLATAAAKTLSEVQSDWQAWSIMDHPKAIDTRRWIQDRLGQRLEPASNLDNPHFTPRFKKLIRAYQLTDSRWFAWANGNITWSALLADSAVNGNFTSNEEMLKTLFPIPLFWALDSSDDSVQALVLNAIQVYSMERSGTL